MLNKLQFNRLFINLNFLFLMLLLSACSVSSAREWLKAPGWSHGLPVGETRIGDPVPIAVDENGGIYLFSITAENESLQPTVTALNRQAEIIWKRALAIPLSQPDKPTVFWEGQTLHLFWLSDRALYTAQMDTSGNVIGAVKALSGQKIVDSYDVALTADGSLSVWYAGQRRDPGIYALDGDLTGESILVDPNGVRPTLQVDDGGTLHAVWAHYPPGFQATRFYYAAFPDGAYQPGHEMVVYEPILSTSDILVGPTLGLDTRQVYLFWNISVRTGPEAGKNLTQYLRFPKEQPISRIGPELLIVPGVSELEYTYQPSDGLMSGSRVFPFTGQYPGTLTVSDVSLNMASSPASELALAFDVQTFYEFRKERGQVGVVYLEDGEPNGYQLLSFTPDASVDPAIISDESGALYLTWLERGDDVGFQIYFASTAPDIKNALAGMTWGDAMRIGRETIFGLLSGAVLTPIIVTLWLIMPLLILLLTSFLRRENEDKLTGLGTLFSLLLAATAYWGVKLLTIPGIASFVPFAAWIPAIPDWLQAPLQIGVPVAITLVAIRVAWHFTYRQRAASLLYFVILFAAVDGLLTMSIYGFVFYNLI